MTKQTKNLKRKITNKVTRKYKDNLAGDINKYSIFQHIKSIGFEIETTDLIKFTLEKYKKREILVNSALTNIDLEYGYFDENEYTDIIDTPELKFKITNDSAEDSQFNEELETLFDSHKDGNGDCKKTVFKLNIPKNEYLKQTKYDIKIREPDLELHNCSSFTDVEWIITYYKPEMSKNIILNTFYNSMILLRDHLSKLKTIHNSKLYYLNEENKYVKFENAKINQVYILPETSLVYYNNSIYDIQNYNINENLKIVVQMTFSCDIAYVFRIMKKLLSIEYTSKQLEIVKKYLEKSNKNIENINELIEVTMRNENFDLDAVDNALEIVKKMFKSYNDNTENSEYLFVSDNSNTKKLKMYFFLIMYKLYIYLNSYLQNKQDNAESLFKKSLSFAVRHNNYFLYLEVKKLIRHIFSSKFEGKDEKYINEKIIQIVENIIKPVNTQKDIFNLLYIFPYVRDKKKELYKSLKANPEQVQEYFGDPLLSISSYFTHFENPQKENEEDEIDESDENRDWLVSNEVDEKSTKFELNNDTIIIEFRDFPSYSYLNLLISGDDSIREEILKNNVGTLNMSIVNEYIKLHNL
jgi:hypothetical protein